MSVAPGGLCPHGWLQISPLGCTKCPQHWSSAELGPGAGDGWHRAARTHGADSLGMFQNTSHAPGLNCKKPGHLHVQNALGKKKKKREGEKKNPEGGTAPTKQCLCAQGRWFQRLSSSRALCRGAEHRGAARCWPSACYRPILSRGVGKWEEEPELPRTCLGECLFLVFLRGGAD